MGKIFIRWVLIGSIGPLFMLTCQVARANGGTVVYNGDTGPFNIYMVLSPTPPTIEAPVHFTLLITKKGTDLPVNSATVLIEPQMSEMAMPEVGSQPFLQNPARLDQYDVDVRVQMEGEWKFLVTVSDPQIGQTTFLVETRVEKSNIPWTIIIAILVGFPLMTWLSWRFLFKEGNNKNTEDEDEEE